MKKFESCRTKFGKKDTVLILGVALVLSFASCQPGTGSGNEEGEVKNTESLGVASNAPDGFVEIKGATVSGQVANSKVFIQNRTVTIPDMYVSDHEVTQSEYEKYCQYLGVDHYGDRLCPDTGNGKGDNYPAYYVNWYDAIVYCNLRSIDEGFTPAYKINNEENPANWPDIVSETSNDVIKYCGPSDSEHKNDTWDAVTYNTEANGYRLPTQAEWEYIARGGNNGIPATQTTYAGSNNIDEVAWYKSNSNNKTHEVKEKKPISNKIKIYDMSGNVAEWCYDWSSHIWPAVPATGLSSGETRLNRGGSYYDSDTDFCTIAKTPHSMPFDRIVCVGFRVVRNVN